MTTRQIGVWFTSFGLILALAYDIGFYQKGLGINFLVFMVLAVLGFTALAVKTKLVRNNWAWWLLAPTIALATAPALYNNEFATSAAPILAGLTWLVFAMTLTIETIGLPFYLSQLPLIGHLDRLVTNWKNIYHDLFAHEAGSAKRVVMGLVIAFPILLIFAGLLAAADPIFADWLKNLNIWEGIWRVFRTLMLTLFLGAFFYLIASDKNKLRERVTKVFKLDAVTVGVVLALVNALFALFVYIQIKYLFGGASFVLTNNVSLAEYARSGFFELLRVLVLAAVLIIGTHRSFAHHGSHKVVNMLQALFIVQVGVVAASALRRMGLYQDAYGFTSLRLYVEWFIYAVMGALVFSGVALVIKFQFRKFFQVGITAALVVAAVVSLINVDLVIARENISRFKAGQPLDVNYLSSLSRDSAPALIELFDENTLSKLNVNQTFILRDMVNRFKDQTASTTPWGMDWSTKQSEKTLKTLPEPVVLAFRAAEVKDIQYRNAMNGVNINQPNYTNCIIADEQTNQNPVITKTNPVYSCVNLEDTPNLTKQAQIVVKNQNNERPVVPVYNEPMVYSNAVNGDIYYQVVNYDKYSLKTTVLFEQKIQAATKEIKDPESFNNFTIQKDGSVVENNFGAREVNLYRLINDKGNYRLETKQKYSV